jgi:hypothetical protein
MSGDLQKIIKSTLKGYGENAAEHFGVRKGTLDGYMRSGRYPLKLIEKILADASRNYLETGPAEQVQMHDPVPPPTPRLAEMQAANTICDPAFESIQTRVEQIIKYIQGTVDFYIRQYAERLNLLERAVAALSAGQLRQAGSPSLVRPEEGVPVDQIYTTNPNAGLGLGRHPLDTGLAPTKEQVDAQANMAIIEGVPVPGARLAGPAVYNPDAPPFGFDWNKPRSRK